MKNAVAGWTGLIVTLASAGSLLAHHSLALFDTTTAVRVRGVVVRFEQVNPHSILFVDEKGADGRVQRWAIEGPGVTLLRRMGMEIGKTPFKVGDVVEACGYVTKDSAKSQRTMPTEPISLDLRATTPKSMTGRLLAAEELTLPNGERRRWEDYGDHKCLGPDFVDIHLK